MSEQIEITPQKVEYVFECSSSSEDEPVPFFAKELSDEAEESESESESESEEKQEKNNTMYYYIIIGIVVLLLGCTIPKCIPSSDNIVYPLLLEPHDTTSIPYNHDVTVKNRIVSQLKLHLIDNPQYQLLCMHHLKVPIPYIKICVMYAHPVGQFITMLNPKLIGGSTVKSMYNEKSVACANTSSNERQKSVMVEWYSGTDMIYSLFGEMESVMLQMIIDEQNGQIKC